LASSTPELKLEDGGRFKDSLLVDLRERYQALAIIKFPRRGTVHVKVKATLQNLRSVGRVEDPNNAEIVFRRGSV
jgi:hypothetical protein